MNYQEIIINKLIECEATYRDVFGKKQSVSNNVKYVENFLKYLPERNLKSIIYEYPYYRQNMSVNDWVSYLANEGLLKFKPYVTKNSNGDTILALRYNRFLHLDRCFRVSYTSDGVGEYRTGIVPLNMLKNFLVFNSAEELFPIYFYTNCITAGTGLEVFDTLLRESPKVVDKFVKEVALSSGMFIHYNVKYADIKDLFTVVDNRTEIDSLAYYRTFNIPSSDTSDFCRVYSVTSTKLYIEKLHNGVPIYYKLEMPILKDCEETKHNKLLLDATVLCALNMFGFMIDCHTVYPVKKCDTLMALSSKIPTPVHTLFDFDF